ncbi:unnamed protein product [Discula destructiva]
MYSCGLASLLATPPALRRVLLQALAQAPAPPSALVSPAIYTLTQCRWKTTTSRTVKKNITSSGPSKKKTGQSSASARKSTPAGSSRGKNPNGYPSGAKKALGAGLATASKGKGKNPNGYPPRAKSSQSGSPAVSKGKNPNGYPPRPKTQSREAPFKTSKGRDSPSFHSETESSRGASRTFQNETARSQPKAKSLRSATPLVSSTTIDSSSPDQPSPPQPAKKTMPRPRLTKKHDSSAPHSAPTALSFLPPPPTLPVTATLAPEPTKLDLIRTATIFRDPKFLYSAPRFLNLPVNTRMPEICLLGRSNVGKSTLINALGGFGGKKAGTVHVTTSGKLAITSATAGCTKTMNAYGFGPPASVRPLTRKEQKARKDAGLSRSEKRAGQTKVPPEALPKHNMVLMDMPGYGQNSRADWGEEIMKYLNRREILSGAVLLIDAVAGVKDGDRGVLEVLRDAGLTTSVVLTKADKLVTDSDPEAWRGSARIREACEHIWAELRRVEGAGQLSSWWEGEGWTPEVFVTGAGDPKMGGMGVDGARVAIARLAGLIDAPAREVAPPPDIVPYDQIVFSVPSSMPKFEVKPVVQQEEVVRERRPVVGRGRTRLRTVAKAPPDPLQAMEAAIRRPSKRGQMGKASF